MSSKNIESLKKQIYDDMKDDLMKEYRRFLEQKKAADVEQAMRESGLASSRFTAEGSPKRRERNAMAASPIEHVVEGQQSPESKASPDSEPRAAGDIAEIGALTTKEEAGDLPGIRE